MNYSIWVAVTTTVIRMNNRSNYTKDNYESSDDRPTRTGQWMSGNTFPPDGHKTGASATTGSATSAIAVIADTVDVLLLPLPFIYVVVAVVCGNDPMNPNPSSHTRPSSPTNKNKTHRWN